VDIPRKNSSVRSALDTRHPVPHNRESPELSCLVTGKSIAIVFVQPLDSGVFLIVPVQCGGVGGAREAWTTTCARALRRVALVDIADTRLGGKIRIGTGIPVRKRSWQ
jgi:hypothetical protein